MGGTARALLAFALVSALAALIAYSARGDAEAGANADADAIRARIAAHPLAGEAYRHLAEMDAGAGTNARAIELHEIAARRAPRDRASHLWLADHHARSGHSARALFHLDHLMRLSPRRAHHLFPGLGALLMTPSSRAELIAFLGQSERPWRSNFLRWFSAQPGLAPLLGEVFEPLRKANAPLHEDERGYWIERLLQEGRIDEAYFLWIDALPAERRASIGNVYDGGFEFDASSGGVFDWQFRAVPGAAISRAQTRGMEGEQALLIEFFDRRVPFAHVQQRLALPSGDYVLGGRVRSEDLRNERGLRWRLLCGPDLMASSEAFRGSSEWRDFQVAFTVPTRACAGQTLQLHLDARIRPEQLIGGRVWFDALRIRRRN